MINNGNASDLDIYNMEAYYLFSKLREMKENSYAVPALKYLTSSYNDAQRKFLKQLKRDFWDRHGFKQELENESDKTFSNLFGAEVQVRYALKVWGEAGIGFPACLISWTLLIV